MLLATHGRGAAAARAPLVRAGPKAWFRPSVSILSSDWSPRRKCKRLEGMGEWVLAFVLSSPFCARTTAAAFCLLVDCLLLCSSSGAGASTGPLGSFSSVALQLTHTLYSVDSFQVIPHTLAAPLACIYRPCRGLYREAGR